LQRIELKGGAGHVTNYVQLYPTTWDAKQAFPDGKGGRMTKIVIEMVADSQTQLRGGKWRDRGRQMIRSRM